MSDKTGIEWTDATWNPVRGCSLVSDLFKQWGEWAPHEAKAGGDEGGDLRRGHVRYLQGNDREPDGRFRRGGAAVARVGKNVTGRLHHGVQHDGYTSDNNVGGTA